MIETSWEASSPASSPAPAQLNAYLEKIEREVNALPEDTPEERIVSRFETDVDYRMVFGDVGGC